MHIVGTAGHVDHGKSALIAALTGTNPDRLIEERLRGMTLDLGFAHLRFDDGVEGGIVDVPGHERFLHNMLAGAAGMELLLLAVDAGEGVMPQTLEHLQILQFLNVRRVLVALTKIDLIDPPQRDAAGDRVRRQLQGTIAADAPIYPVSSLSGEGLDAFKTALHCELAALTPRNSNAPVYLPIDRVFALAGLGTIVTGTLMQGSISAGETLLLEPGGKPAHVRSIGVFGSTLQNVNAGSRVALNLPGIARHEIARGQAIVGREFGARSSFAVRFVPLQSSTGLLRRKLPVRAYIGSAETLGTLVVEDALDAALELRAQLHLREPVVGFPGLRFVLRRPSPMTLLGGGFIEGIDVQPSANGGFTRGEGAVLAVLRAKPLEALEPHAIALAANLRESAARDAAERLVERGEAICVSRPQAFMEAAAAGTLLTHALARLDEVHHREPWAMGATSIALARALGVSESLFVRVAAHFVEAGRLINRGGYYASVDHRPSLTPEQRAFLDGLVPADELRPFQPVPFAGVVSAVKLSHVSGLSKAFDTTLANGSFVKVGDDLYRDSQIVQIRARVEAHFSGHERMTAAEFRDLLGTSRKYALPLLEWLDSRGVTIRDGDYRKLRKRMPVLNA
ncbi:MAG: selenocysteine-specific translation elongation factor [Candidatus Eremiobacteraeota bacterium]|nr:selenocysteine-specific translation elongation factor [Candidatus Eremiobacteraeota bacterium]